MRSIVFVYNAKSGLFSALTDYATKIVSPDKYECNLCGLTYGNVGMKKIWKEFIAHLGYEVEFLHRDEFEKKYQQSGAAYPNAFVKIEDKLSLLITAEEMNACKTLDDLIALVTRKVKKISS